jgi:hypothetical protein
MSPKQDQMRASAKPHSAELHGKDIGSHNISYTERVESDSESKSALRVCKGCGTRFVPAGPQKFCCHDCYSNSLRAPIETRFWNRVNKTDTCWLWTGSTICGYGSIAGVLNGKRRPLYIHRVAWEMTHGPIPDGLKVCHHCDVPLCVRPEHLFLGTQQENLDDARAKGRLIDGLQARRLSDDAYREILSTPKTYGSNKALATKHGITKVSVSRIRRGTQGAIYQRSLKNVEPVRFVQVPVRGVLHLEEQPTGVLTSTVTPEMGKAS